MEIAANFTLNNEALNAQFDVSQTQNFDALFQIDSQLQVVGDGLINVTTANGVATVTSVSFVFEQGIASDVWVIEHNLNKKPSIVIVDSADTVISVYKAEYNGLNALTIYFNGAFTGKAYLN